MCTGKSKVSANDTAEAFARARDTLFPQPEEHKEVDFREAVKAAHSRHEFKPPLGPGEGGPAAVFRDKSGKEYEVPPHGDWQEIAVTATDRALASLASKLMLSVLDEVKKLPVKSADLLALAERITRLERDQIQHSADVKLMIDWLDMRKAEKEKLKRCLRAIELAFDWLDEVRDAQSPGRMRTGVTEVACFLEAVMEGADPDVEAEGRIPF